MRGFQLKFYLRENQKHEGILLYEWLIEKAQKMGVHGGTVFRAIAGFGRKGVFHEEHFFELGANLPVETIFILNEEECNAFLGMLKRENLDLFFVKVPVEYGFIKREN